VNCKYLVHKYKAELHTNSVWNASAVCLYTPYGEHQVVSELVNNLHTVHGRQVWIKRKDLKNTDKTYMFANVRSTICKKRCFVHCYPNFIFLLGDLLQLRSSMWHMFSTILLSNILLNFTCVISHIQTCSYIVHFSEWLTININIPPLPPATPTNHDSWGVLFLER